MSKEQSVNVSNLTVVKQKKPILNDISFTLPRGKLIGLMGPSGSGKTTLMRSLLGVQIPTHGTVTILESPAGASALRSQIGYVSQSPAVYSDLTVKQNLAYFAVLVGVKKSRVAEVLDEVDLVPQSEQLVATLSGGQTARVSLAIALLGSPSVLILDEPTVGLDPVLRVQLWTLFHELTKAGTTIVVSSHVMDEAERCDELLLLRAGELLWQGVAKNLLKETGADSVENAFIRLVRGGKN